MSTYVIGDIQGCAYSLQRLLSLIHPNWQQGDEIWIAGDLVNRGARSLDVLLQLHDLWQRHPQQVKIVLGNHDIHLLMLHYGLTHPRKGDTLDAILKSPHRETLITWLTEQPILHRKTSLIMVHAGLLPQWTEDQAEALAQEVSILLRKDPALFLQHVYGNEPTQWHDNLEGIDRYRVIVNAMTRLRFCTMDGIMEFHSKGQPQHAPKDFVPWYEAPHVRHADTTVAFGHWSQLGLRYMPNHISLDSGCLWEGTLTAVRIEDRHFFQVPRHHEDAPPYGYPRDNRIQHK
jgi:bis(5'-nucleosyl)-tetraphosphatase (symmetrical)